MKTNIYIINICLSVCLFTTSCTKEWLNKKPELSAAIPATLQDCQALMDHNQLFSGIGGLKEMASDNLYFTDANAALYLKNTTINAYTWSNTLPYNEVPDWNGAYTIVYYCNLVLETLNKISRSSTNSVEWDNIKGQALFHRSIAFHELVQTFSPAYVSTTANTDLGIPLRLESDINGTSRRSTIQEAYDLIEKDLLEAKKLLPVTPLNKQRPSKPAVFGLLARMYLSMEKYSDALLNADSSLYYYPTLLNYYQLNQTANRPFIKYNAETIFYAAIANYGTMFNTRFNIPESLYQLYDNNDLRKNLFFTKNVATGFITFKGFYLGSNAQINGITSDEQYLIRAECYARTGNVVLALKDLNDLLKTRWSNTVPYPTITAATAEAALPIILLERRKQLLLRGLRWADLRRLNRDTRFVTSLTHTLQGITYTLEPGSYKYTFPIPDDVVQMTGMEQNKNWVH